MNSSSFLYFLLVVLFFTSLATLLFELALTRIFSIVLWYDYAFMAISVAFFGLGIGSLVVHIRKDRIKLSFPENKNKANNNIIISSKILRSIIAYCVSIPLFILVVELIPADTSFIYFFYLVSSIPFFFAGSIMAWIFFAMPQKINKLYFADLLGAACATLILDPLMQTLGAESVLLMTSVLVSGSSSVIIFLSGRQQLESCSFVNTTISSRGSMRNLLRARINILSICLFATVVGSLLLLVVNSVSGNAIFEIHPGVNKGLYFQITHPSQFQHLSTDWNSFSRVDVTQKIIDRGSKQGISNSNNNTNVFVTNGNNNSTKNAPRELASIIIDADAATPIFRWNGTRADLLWLHSYMDYLPYEIVKANRTLVIGGGGGEDILTSIAANVKNVTAVELNPLVVSSVNHFGDLAGNLYNREDVHLSIDDGRRFISSTNSKYDTIVIKLVDSWAAQLAGGYALSENYLYTVEGFEQYLNHLDPNNGMLVMVRWNFELPRLMPLIVDSLTKETGKSSEDVSKNIVAVEDRPGLYFGRSNENQTYYPLLVMVKSNPFTSKQLDFIKERAKENHAEIFILGNSYIRSPYDLLFSNDSNDYAKYLSSVVASNPKVPTDDSPFYFAREQIPHQMVILLGTVLVISAAVAVLLAFHVRKNHVKMNTASMLHLIFAVCIGIGFMFLEITFIQKFLLLLGTPIMALTVILFSVLLSTGVGAYLSGSRLFASYRPQIMVLVSVPILAGIILFHFLFLQDIISSTITFGLIERAAIAFGLLSPIGFLMGFQFPSLIRMATFSSLQNSSRISSSQNASEYNGSKDDAYSNNLSRNDLIGSGNSNSTTLLWGANVIASIIGTVLAAMLAMIVGFNGNLLIGILAYAGACVSCLLTLFVCRSSAGLAI